MYELMLSQIRPTPLGDLLLAYLLSQRRRELRTNGPFIRRAYRDGRFLRICG
jgi:hypothetical protein